MGDKTEVFLSSKEKSFFLFHNDERSFIQFKTEIGQKNHFIDGFSKFRLETVPFQQHFH